MNVVRAVNQACGALKASRKKWCRTGGKWALQVVEWGMQAGASE
jgi:hypothetical protein